MGISSLIDAWISLRNSERNGARHCKLFLLKARGIAHSNQIGSFLLTTKGIKIGEMELSDRNIDPTLQQP